MRLAYIVQALDDGSFLGNENGEYRYYTDMRKAYRFGSLEIAMIHARDIDETLDDNRVAIIEQFYPSL